jgi:hypothetical protein
MIPDFVEIGGPWKVLPPGIHYATLKEIKDLFATNDHRKYLFSGFARAVKALRQAGCQKIFLDGSFITEKSFPGDYDVCWDPIGVDSTKIHPVFLDFSNKRKKQKKIFYGEFFPSTASADGKKFFLDYFQVDKHTGSAKGIICLKFPKS